MTEKQEMLSSLLGAGKTQQLSSEERRKMAILIIDNDQGIRSTLRSVLIGAGIGSIADAPSHVQGLEKLQTRQFTHIVFDAKTTNMPPRDFLIKALEYDNQLICIPISYEPTVDDVFNLLIVGARGYMVKPISTSSVEDAIALATKGERISEAILYAKDRNEALASLIMASLDKLSVISRQARSFDTAKRELPKRTLVFHRSVQIGRTFAEGGEARLLEAIVNFCIERAEGPATRLGRLRRRLEERRPSAGGNSSQKDE